VSSPLNDWAGLFITGYSRTGLKTGFKRLKKETSPYRLVSKIGALLGRYGIM